jgi:hypothetical protein
VTTKRNSILIPPSSSLLSYPNIAERCFLFTKDCAYGFIHRHGFRF